MLDQLVESKSHMNEDKRRSSFMLVTLIIAVIGVLTAWGVDLFGKDFGMGGDDLALTTLVAPVPVPDEEPPPEPEKKPEQKQPDVDVRKELIQNIMSSPIKPPEKTVTEKIDFKAMRENVKTMQGSDNLNTGADVGVRGAGVVSSGSTDGLATTGTETTGGDDAPPPPPKATPKPAPKTISGGVMNGKATSLPKPAYPAAAKAVRASGSVSVQVLISESGSVISASAVSGHPLLRLGCGRRRSWGPL